MARGSIRAPKVFDTLRLLVENAGHLMTKEKLLRHLWPDTVVDENNLNKNISVLRKVLDQPFTSHSFIETVPRAGYRFVGRVTESTVPRVFRITTREGAGISGRTLAAAGQTHEFRPQVRLG